MKSLAFGVVAYLVAWEIDPVSGFYGNAWFGSFALWKTNDAAPTTKPRAFFSPHLILFSSASGGGNSSDGLPEEENDDEKSNKNDINLARQQLESLLGGDLNSLADTNSNVDVEALMDPRNAHCIADILPTQPPLTSSERDRRLVEIEILADLEDSDEPLQNLWDLWFAERGRAARDRLEQADTFMSSGQATAAENMLKKIIQDYGVYWVEPLNRLATLMYLEGRLEESYQLCLVVLHLRPYHFGALSGIVAVSTAMRDREKARRWAEKRLPSLVSSTSFPPFASDGPKNPRRRAWVQKAVKYAEDALCRLENQTKKGFGKPEQYYKRAASSPPSMSDEPQQSQYSTGSMDTSDDDAWQ